MSGAARGLCDANCHLHGQGDSFHVATCAAEIAREQLATALVESNMLHRSDPFRWDFADALLPVVDRIANERAAAALEAAADDVPGLIPSTPDYLHSRAAALRASNGEGT